MRTELIDMADLSDSREVMEKKAPPAITIFINILAVVLVVALIWSYFGKIDTYITASGEIRPENDVGTLTSLNGGKIKSISYEDGATVNEGDILISFDCDYYISQKENIEGQVVQKQKDIENYNKLINSIQSDKNLFNESSDGVFYYEYENYKLELQSTLQQITDGNSQVNSSKKEIEQSISNATSSLNDIKNLYNEYSSFYNAIKNDKEYTGSNESLKSLYNNYISSLNKAQIVYDNYVSSYDSLIKQQEENPDSVTQEQIEQASYSKKNAYADLTAIKNNMLIEINETLSELKQQQETLSANIDSYKLKKEALSYSNNADESKKKLKNSYYININSTIKSIEKEIEALNTQLHSIDESISQSDIKAAQSGIITYSQSYSVGDTLNAGTTIGTIIPSSEDISVTLYIPEYYISQVDIGQKVEYTFNSISATDFGKVYGEIIEISADSFTDQTSGQKFYKAKATIDKSVLTNDLGETRTLKTGMIVEVHAITGSQRILYWLLDKLNFK